MTDDSLAHAKWVSGLATKLLPFPPEVSLQDIARSANLTGLRAEGVASKLLETSQVHEMPRYQLEALFVVSREAIAGLLASLASQREQIAVLESSVSKLKRAAVASLERQEALQHQLEEARVDVVVEQHQPFDVAELLDHPSRVTVSREVIRKVVAGATQLQRVWRGFATRSQYRHRLERILQQSVSLPSRTHHLRVHPGTLSSPRDVWHGLESPSARQRGAARAIKAARILRLPDRVLPFLSPMRSPPKQPDPATSDFLSRVAASMGKTSSPPPLRPSAPATPTDPRKRSVHRTGSSSATRNRSQSAFFPDKSSLLGSEAPSPLRLPPSLHSNPRGSRSALPSATPDHPVPFFGSTTSLRSLPRQESFRHRAHSARSADIPNTPDSFAMLARMGHGSGPNPDDLGDDEPPEMPQGRL
jgi:hypothetical protein